MIIRASLSSSEPRGRTKDRGLTCTGEEGSLWRRQDYQIFTDMGAWGSDWFKCVRKGEGKREEPNCQRKKVQNIKMAHYKARDK